MQKRAQAILDFWFKETPPKKRFQKHEGFDQEIRKKWIELNKEHHPDNLIAKGMPEEFIEQSNKELASINLAYDKIKEIRSIS